MNGKFYGAEEFNPRLIATQIVVMQSSFWLCLGSLTTLVDLVLGEPQSAEQLFLPEAYTWSTTRGIGLTAALWVTSLVMAAELRHVVERAKKCLDFVATYHIFHLLATYLASGFPDLIEWWAIQVPSFLVAVLLGEYLCFQSESQAISLKPKPPGKSSRAKPSFDEI
eukprot:TRINITY_DN28979_c0_g1_i2.p1 TRINITY_DN28979_c0_g1~~TRINITY_DN28979_c0_g1_i2.p1  ORF type:complete len:167 (-),score=25.81 TRINITY_DN28979_c0_g1_i2:128-628(-)